MNYAQEPCKSRSLPRILNHLIQFRLKVCRLSCELRWLRSLRTVHRYFCKADDEPQQRKQAISWKSSLLS